MNILVDFVTACLKSGAGEYLRRVLFELINRVQRERLSDVRLFALYDSSVGIAYDDLREKAVEKRCGDIPIAFVDCHGRNLARIVAELKIDVFFIACAQYVGGREGIEDVKCRVVMTVHDVCGEDLVENHLLGYLSLDSGIFDYKRRFRLDLLNTIRHLRLTWRLAKQTRRFSLPGGEYSFLFPYLKLRPAMNMFTLNGRARIVTDSSYAFQAIRYHFGVQDVSRITKLYPPARIHSENTSGSDKNIHELISSGRKYFLMVSAGRPMKNARKALAAFARFCDFNQDISLVIVGYKGNVGNSKRILKCDFLNDYDLDQAYRNCFALLYPSSYEGFGYPPVEVMQYGKPVLCSNATSMPEILGDAPIYFSPFYNADIFKAMVSLADANYDLLSRKAIEQYGLVHERQQRDLETLLSMLLDNRGSIML